MSGEGKGEHAHATVERDRCRIEHVTVSTEIADATELVFDAFCGFARYDLWAPEVQGASHWLFVQEGGVGSRLLAYDKPGRRHLTHEGLVTELERPRRFAWTAPFGEWPRAHPSFVGATRVREAARLVGTRDEQAGRPSALDAGRDRERQSDLEDTRSCRRRIRCPYADASAAARDRIYLTTPCLAHELLVRLRLMAAARRDADIRLQVPSQSNVLMTLWGAHTLCAAMIEARMRIYQYLPRILHAKTVSSDGEWAVLDTASSFDALAHNSPGSPPRLQSPKASSCTRTYWFPSTAARPPTAAWRKPSSWPD